MDGRAGGRENTGGRSLVLFCFVVDGKTEQVIVAMSVATVADLSEGRAFPVVCVLMMMTVVVMMIMVT